MRCWGELKSLRGQSVGEVSAGLHLVEKLATPRVHVSWGFIPCTTRRLSSDLAYVYCTLGVYSLIWHIWGMQSATGQGMVFILCPKQGKFISFGTSLS